VKRRGRTAVKDKRFGVLLEGSGKKRRENEKGGGESGNDPMHEALKGEKNFDIPNETNHYTLKKYKKDWDDRWGGVDGETLWG